MRDSGRCQPRGCHKTTAQNAYPIHRTIGTPAGNAGYLTGIYPEHSLPCEGQTMPQTQNVTREIAFIDPAISDIDMLIASIRPDFAVIILKSIEPAVLQIAHSLMGCRDLSTIHVISHGSPGEVAFAAGGLSIDNLDDCRKCIVAL